MNRRTQNAAAASHRDAVPQVRKFMLFKQLEFDNATTNYSFGVESFNILGDSTPFSQIIGQYANVYEQYRIRLIRVRAQVGKGYTNDRRIKSYVAARVDVDDQASVSTNANLQSLLYSENTSVKTFTERGNVLIAEFRPQNRPTIGNLSQRIVPNAIEWYPTRDVSLHTWKGCVVGAVLPEPGLVPGELALTLSAEVDVEFRGRITNATTFSGNLFQETQTVELKAEIN